MTQKAHQRLTWVWGPLLIGFFALLYITLSPDLAYQPWDSLDYSYSSEVIGISTIRGNHPLGHIVLLLAFYLFKSVGYTGRALNVFQITNGLIGGLTISLCFVMLVKSLGLSPIRALGFVTILGASYSFWFFAGTGDIYIIALMCALVAWAALIHEITIVKNPVPLLSGLGVGLAILSHQLNAFLIPVGIVLILQTHAKNQTPKRKIKQIVTFTASTFITVISGYFLLGYLATATLSPTRILGWAQGYFGDPSYGRYLNLEYFSTALSAATRAILVVVWDNPARLIRIGLLVLLVLLILSGLLIRNSLDTHKRSILQAAALQCFISWPFILWWEPQNLKFWLLTLLPWVIFLAMCFEALRAKIGTKIAKSGAGLAADLSPMLVGMFILLLNANYGMLTQHNPNSADSIAFHQAYDAWVSHSMPQDLLITAGDLVPNLLYWGNRPKTVNLYRSLQLSQSSSDDFADLRRQIEQTLCGHHKVLITPAASDYIPADQLSVVGVSQTSLKTFLEGYTQNEGAAFWYHDLLDHQRLPVYVLTQTETCIK